MCGHKKVYKSTSETPSWPYEGDTRRLDPHSVSAVEQSDGRPTWKHVPWWALWLIWPLFGLIKSMVQSLAAAGASLLDLLTQVQFVRLLPIALIVIGLVLLRQSRR